MNNEMQVNKTADVLQERDALAQIGRVLDYFEEHPNVGLSVCSALAAGGIMGMAVYGSKMFL